MTWNVMIALRQWNRVKDSLTANQEDQLIIEGYPCMQGSQHVLMAQSCVSMLQQRAEADATRTNGADAMNPLDTPATPADVRRQIRESLGLPPVQESTPTVPVEGHVCEFPLWAFSKRRGAVTTLHIPTATLECIAKIFPCKMAVLQRPVTSVTSV